METKIGQYKIVVVDRGTKTGVDQGTELDIRQSGHVQRDTVSTKPNDLVTLPELTAGELLIFKATDRVSFGLVMKSTRPIHLLDAVRQP